MKCSLCIATYNKARWLERVLASIVRQNPPFEWELIVVDDGSVDDTREVCQDIERVSYFRIDRKVGYRNPARARNAAYRRAKGDIIICQSDDVEHIEQDTIDRLVTELEPDTFLIATVWNTNWKGEYQGLQEFPKIKQLTGPKLQRPFFFLGCLLRSDLYAAGGNDELYKEPGREDVAFSESLIYGLNLAPRFVDVLGHHIDHSRPKNLSESRKVSAARHKERRKRCSQCLDSWLSPGAPWPYQQGKSFVELQDG